VRSRESNLVRHGLREVNFRVRARNAAQAEVRVVPSQQLTAISWDDALAVSILVWGGHVLADVPDWWPPGTAILQIIWGALYAAGVWALCRRHGLRWLASSVRWLPLLWLVLAIALASSLWSFDPSITLRRALSMIGTTVLGVYLGYSFEQRSLARVLFLSLVILITSSIVVAVAAPEYGVAGGAWKGITGNRNSLAMMAALGTVFFLVQSLCGRVDWRYGLGLAGVSLFVLIMTGSATSTLAVAGGTAVVLLFHLSDHPCLRPRMLAGLLLLAVALGGLGLALAVHAQHDVMASGRWLSGLEQVAELLDRDVTLTGRTHLWSGALQIIAERPWTGYGFEIVWGFGDETYLPHVAATASSAPDAHNAYLDLATELGLPAAVAALLLMIRTWFAAAGAFERRRSWFALLAIGVLFMFMVINLTESIMFISRDTPWILFVAIAVALERHRTSANLDRHSSRRRRKSRPPQQRARRAARSA
jgi:exopolysaccharide production protein ExoQ